MRLSLLPTCWQESVGLGFNFATTWCLYDIWPFHWVLPSAVIIGLLVYRILAWVWPPNTVKVDEDA